MVNDLLNEKRKRGRPVGSSPSLSTIILVRNNIRDAMEECERRGFPLHMLIADEMINSGSASTVLNKLSKFLPNEINISVGDTFSDALKEVQNRLAEQGEIIDVDYEEGEED